MAEKIAEGPVLPPVATHPPQTVLDILERIAKIFAIVAIPVVIPMALAIYSARVQKAAQMEAVNRDYVQLAVSLLKEKRTLDPGIRDWAVDLLAEHSPTRFKPEVIASLKSGIVFLDSGGRILSVSTASNDYKLIARTNAGGIEIMRVPSEQIVKMINIGEAVNDIEFSDDDSLLAIGCQHGSTFIYEAGEWTLIATFRSPEPVIKVIFQSNQKVLVNTTSGHKAFTVPKH